MRPTTWQVQVVSAITVKAAEGSSSTLDPGDYTMREIDVVRYEIFAGETRVRCRFTEVLRLRTTGALVIHGSFP